MNLSQRNKFLLIIVSLGIVVYIFFCFKEIKQMKEMEFNGIVQDVQYDIKGGATIKINNVIYEPASNNWTFRGQIQKGDSLVKLKNTMDIKLIKQKTGREIIFN
jgi:hypothetical protein